MAKGFRCGPGGGTLAFRVTAYATQELMAAASPPDRTLGIVTDQKITGWCIAVGRPDTEKIGCLWIRTGKSSMGALNALAHNEIRICPLGAQQLTEDGWVDRVGMTFLNGTWKAWEPEVTYLFTPGNQYMYLTGGWSGTDQSSGSIYVSYSEPQSSVGVPGYVRSTTAKEIDVTEFGVLSVTLDSCDRDFYVYLLDGSGNIVCSAQAAGTSGVVTMDLSNVAGAYRIQLYASGTYTTNWATAHFSVSEVKLINQDLEGEMAAALKVLGVDV